MVAGLLSTGASAQDATESKTTEPSSGIEEVVVTARRTAENLQDVPISISAFTGDFFEDAGLAEFSDISLITPNFQIAPRGATGATFANLTIRAQTSGFLTLNADQAVGIYVNGAPVTRGTGLFTNLFDVERIEILRGPQGTLYGMNTTGGAVSVITKGPELNEFSSFVEGTLGDFDQRDIEGVVNIPLIDDKLALRVGVQSTNRDGYGQGFRTGVELADDDEITVRASALYEPTDRVSMRLNSEWHKADEAGSIFRSLTTVLDGFVALETPSDDFYDGNEFGDLRQFADSEEFSINLTTTIDFDQFTLESITAYRDQDADLGYQHSAITSVLLGQDSDLFSQELRFSGSSDRTGIDWQAGLFYSNEDGEDQDFLPGLGQLELTAAKNESYAVFAQGTIDLSEQLSATIGVRYTDVEREVRDLEAGAPILSADADFDAVTWLASVDYKANEDVLLYASVSRGFRSGSIDQGNLDTIVDPEFVVNYEVGFKSDFWGQRVRVNGAYYYSDYTDIQRTSFDPSASVPVTILRNAAEATITGFEFDITAAPLEGLSMTLTTGYTDADYDEFVAGDGLGNLIDRTDEPFGGPSWQVSLSARYEFLAGNIGLMGIQGNYFWQSEDDRATEQLLAALTPAQARIDDYGIFNAQIDLRIGEQRPWKFALFGTNLTDEEYFTGAIITPVGSLGTVSNRIVGEPRTYGLRVKKSF